MPVQHCRMLGGLMVLILALPPLAALTARSTEVSASETNLTLIAVELVVASGLVLAWHLRRYLAPEPQPRLVPVTTSSSQPARSSKAF